ncbi:MAG: helix-turn-helix domain-containing protein [Rubripirellula sp.]|nr:helix-turn-helix domain-containing protein [Rubripirellula sp.]
MTKRKSEKRFEQLGKIRDVIIPSLPSGRNGIRGHMAAVLYSCWAQARGADCKFDATNQQIADAAGIDRRSVIRIMGELERAGIVKTIKRGSGHRGSIRVITGQVFKEG